MKLDAQTLKLANYKQLHLISNGLNNESELLASGTISYRFKVGSTNAKEYDRKQYNSLVLANRFHKNCQSYDTYYQRIATDASAPIERSMETCQTFVIFHHKIPYHLTGVNLNGMKSLKMAVASKSFGHCQHFLRLPNFEGPRNPTLY